MAFHTVKGLKRNKNKMLIIANFWKFLDVLDMI
jgi:hypothetical protein